MPSREVLADYGLNDEEIEDIQNSFRYISRDANKVSFKPASELERMIVDNDCSALTISQVQFLDWPKKHRNGTVVAHWEADQIVVLQSGTVVAFDHANLDAPPVLCAKNSESFFDALAFLIEVISNKLVWRGRAMEVAEICTRKAGGGVYRDFFESLCAFLQ